jgi:hypothetical protein
MLRWLVKRAIRREWRALGLVADPLHLDDLNLRSLLTLYQIIHRVAPLPDDVQEWQR